MRRGAAQALAQVVAERMGGRFAYDELEARYAAAAAQRKAAAGGLVTRIGDLQVGLARHRALLFKALADACELPCRLLRGPMHLGAPPRLPLSLLGAVCHAGAFPCTSFLCRLSCKGEMPMGRVRPRAQLDSTSGGPARTSAPPVPRCADCISALAGSAPRCVCQQFRLL